MARLLIIALSALALAGCSEAKQSFTLKPCENENLTINQTINCISAAVSKEIDKKKNPATFLTVVDNRVMQGDPKLIIFCHTAMHKSGRDFVFKNKLTLADLERYTPRSDNSNCPAGFTHGMISAIGINRSNAAELLKTCARQKTRSEQYSCAHGVGHSFNRFYENDVAKTAKACLALESKTAQSWCAQGMYHDYFIATSGGLYSRSEIKKEKETLRVCQDGPRDFLSECYFRLFQAENRPEVRDSRILKSLCPRDREDCIRGAATSTVRDNNIVNVCSELREKDALACLSGSGLIIPDYSVSSQPDSQALIYRRSTLNPLIDQCLGLRGSKLKESCVYWIAFRSTRSISVDIRPADALDICDRLDRSLYRSCERGILDSTKPVNQ